MLSSKSLFVLCSFLPSVILADFTILSWNKDLYHSDPSLSKTVTPWTATQVALESLRLPTQSSEYTPTLDVQTNLLQKIKLYVVLQIEGTNVENLSQLADAHVVLSRPLGLKMDFSKVPQTVASIHQAKYGNKGMVLCPGNKELIPGCRLFKSDVSQSLEQEFSQLDAVANVFTNSLDYKELAADEYPDLLVLSSQSLISSSNVAEDEKAYMNQVEKLLQSLRKVYGDDIAMQITTSSREVLQARRLQSNDTSVVNEDPVTATGPSMAEIESYQILLWTSVSLVLVLFVSLCCMCNMPVGRDSMLYAKFQTDRKTK